MTKFFISNLLEYLYDALSCKTKDFLFDRLNREDFKKISTQSRIKKFVQKETLEEKLLLLSKLNHGCAVIIWDKEKIKGPNVKDVLIAYLQVEENDLLTTVVKDKIFANVSTDLIRSIQTISKVTNSKVYKINSQYREIGRIREDMGAGLLTSKLQADNNFEWLVSKVDNALSLEPLLEKNNLTVDQFRLLLFLQLCPNGATTLAMRNKIGKNISVSINHLYTSNMIDYAVGSKNVMVIDTHGLILVEQIVSKL